MQASLEYLHDGAWHGCSAITFTSVSELHDDANGECPRTPTCMRRSSTQCKPPSGGTAASVGATGPQIASMWEPLLSVASTHMINETESWAARQLLGLIAADSGAYSVHPLVRRLGPTGGPLGRPGPPAARAEEDLWSCLKSCDLQRRAPCADASGIPRPAPSRVVRRHDDIVHGERMLPLATLLWSSGGVLRVTSQ